MWPQSKVCLSIPASSPHSWEDPSSPRIWKWTWKAMTPKSDFLVVASSWVPVHLSDSRRAQAQPVSSLHVFSAHTHAHVPTCALCVLSCLTCPISVKCLSSYSVTKCWVWIIFYSFFFLRPCMNTDSKTIAIFLYPTRNFIFDILN